MKILLTLFVVVTFWLAYFIGYEFLPSKPSDAWYSIPLLITLIVSWVGHLVWTLSFIFNRKG